MSNETKPSTRTRESIREDLVTKPHNHIHTYDELVACCMIDGALDLQLFDDHHRHVDLGSNGGVKCDTIDGPCACGAWHKRDEQLKKLSKGSG